jgi:uncharacterized membrane protein
MAPVLLALALISTGLYAGMMLIFLTGVMPALAGLTDDQFVTAMRRINEQVPRAVFMTVFAAVVAMPWAAFAVRAEGRTGADTVLLLAGAVCGVLNHLVTVAGNVPLNSALAAAASGDRPDGEARAAFESRWNRLHLARTLLVLAAFVLIAASAV